MQFRGCTKAQAVAPCRTDRDQPDLAEIIPSGFTMKIRTVALATSALSSTTSGPRLHGIQLWPALLDIAAASRTEWVMSGQMRKGHSWSWALQGGKTEKQSWLAAFSARLAKLGPPRVILATARGPPLNGPRGGWGGYGGMTTISMSRFWGSRPRNHSTLWKIAGISLSRAWRHGCSPQIQHPTQEHHFAIRILHIHSESTPTIPCLDWPNITGCRSR